MSDNLIFVGQYRVAYSTPTSVGEMQLYPPKGVRWQYPPTKRDWDCVQQKIRTQYRDAFVLAITPVMDDVL